MTNIIYIEDQRRPERNEEFKEFITNSSLREIISFRDISELKNISEQIVNGVICHSGMDGYNIIKKYSKKNKCPLLSYSGSVDSLPYLTESEFTKELFIINSDFFKLILPEFIQYCTSKNDSTNE
ncbi:hypothetical protein CTM80_17245 [Photobacterium phosphoreum]|nr:hypothetical protein CTM80_17245 [Photobacterium phosphoreum]